MPKWSVSVNIIVEADDPLSAMTNVQELLEDQEDLEDWYQGFSDMTVDAAE